MYMPRSSGLARQLERGEGSLRVLVLLAEYVCFIITSMIIIGSSSSSSRSSSSSSILIVIIVIIIYGC